MDVVIQDDNPDHDPEAERGRLLAAESAAVLPAGHKGQIRYKKVTNKMRSSLDNTKTHLRCFQHDFTHHRHCA